jgi:hypothetical protein
LEKFKQFLKNIAPITDSEFVETYPYLKEQNLKKGDIFVKRNSVYRYIGFIKNRNIRVFYNNQKNEETTYGFCLENCLTTTTIN